jgi:type II secretory ATPase GspE/PulE/Tfp pilus assembly ATPase PilB-like protein
MDDFHTVVMRSQGTLLLTGPSSSGKTTTIYALLHEMLRLQKHTTNIVTIEDPYEPSMDHISQIQVNPHFDFTFATALRSNLRQDPEVLILGEIRDLETAKLSVQAAQLPGCRALGSGRRSGTSPPPLPPTPHALTFTSP